LVRHTSVEYAELVASVRDRGVLQPLLVRPRGDKFEVVEGGHRLAAAREAQLATVPCKVQELTDDEVLTIQVQTNAIRPQTERADFADRLQDIVEKRQLTMPQLAAIVHKSPQWLRDTLSLHGLNPKAKEALRRGEVSIKACVALSKLPRKMQADIVDSIFTMGADEFVEKCREVLKNYRECVRVGRTDIDIMRKYEPFPWYRSLGEIKDEAINNIACARVLKQMGAKSAADGWRACLAWMLHLDPEAAQDGKRKQENHQAVALRQKLSRKENREIAQSLLRLKGFKQ
jgi:ParB/RepB/Spo0J family partition protein